MPEDQTPHQDDPQPGPNDHQKSMDDVVMGDFDTGQHRPPDPTQQPAGAGVYWDFDANPHSQDSNAAQPAGVTPEEGVTPQETTTPPETPTEPTPQEEVPGMAPELEQTVQDTPITPSTLPGKILIPPPLKLKTTAQAQPPPTSPTLVRETTNSANSQPPTHPTDDEPVPEMGERVKGFTAGQKYFDRYVLKRVLGRGGMGIVWLAHDEKLEREVALKFLPEVVHLDASLLDALKQETKKSLELTHPNILRIYDFIEDTETAAISMEYVDGPTLSKLRTGKPKRIFEIADIGVWMKNMCSALDYAHSECKVVHRDLKPSNIMINSKGQVKIADFGIARSLSDSLSQMTQQKKGVSSGTLPYMSPQQLMGEQPAVSGDVYSLAATVYELLTSRPPFYSGDVASQVVSKIPPSMKDRRQELKIEGEAIPQIWEDTIAGCLSKEAVKRPSSAGAVAHRLGIIDLKGPGESRIDAPTKVVLPASHLPSFSIKKDANFSASRVISKEEVAKAAAMIPPHPKGPIKPIGPSSSTAKTGPGAWKPPPAPMTPSSPAPPSAVLPILPEQASAPAKKSSGKRILRDATVLVLLVAMYGGYLLYGKGKLSAFMKTKKQTITQPASIVESEEKSATTPKVNPPANPVTPSKVASTPSPVSGTPPPAVAPQPAPTASAPPPKPAPTPTKPAPAKPNVSFKLQINGISIFGSDATATLQSGQILEVGESYSYVDATTKAQVRYKVLSITETALIALYDGKEYTFKPKGSDIGKFEETE
jgi:serine/threonine protein kinase